MHDNMKKGRNKYEEMKDVMIKEEDEGEERRDKKKKK